VACPSTCATCINSTICSSCPAGSVVNQVGACVKAPVCKSGQFLDLKTVKCLSCSTSCTACSNSPTNCSACISGHFVNKNNNCVAIKTCPPLSYFNFTLESCVSGASLCPAYQFTTAVSSAGVPTCGKCFSPCAACNATADSCV